MPRLSRGQDIDASVWSGLQALFSAVGEQVAMPQPTEQSNVEVTCHSMKNNLVRFPKPPVAQSEPGPDFEKHHYVFEAPGRRVALDLFTRVTHLTPEPDPPKEPGEAPARPRRTKGSQP